VPRRHVGDLRYTKSTPPSFILLSTTFDHTPLSGPFKGQTQYGIYKVDGDRWTVVVATRPGAKAEDRPREFRTKDMKGRLMVWERVDGGKKR
jgi:hypothetical protein